MQDVAFFNSLNNLIEAITRLMVATSPWGPLLLIYLPAIICLMMRRIGYMIAAALISTIGYGIAAIPGAGLWAGLFIALSWLLIIPAGAARRSGKLRQEIRALRAEQARLLKERD